MEDVTSARVNAGDESSNRFDRPRASLKLRAMGLVYLLLGGVFMWYIFEVPKLVSPGELEYHVPHACECLECGHGYVTGPDGELYCPKYPPKELLKGGPPMTARRLLSSGGLLLGVFGLFFALSMPAAGTLWLLGLWIPGRPLRWYTVACRAAPLMVVLCWLGAAFLKTAYPFAPL
ncbi:MAG: hypothetical protein JSU70_13865 [Phycisphaerales bacterium]|nr:MAG: hypothetical protein JSU70_13865 [Phycisphaerales bacterium]